MNPSIGIIGNNLRAYDLSIIFLINGYKLNVYSENRLNWIDFVRVTLNRIGRKRGIESLHDIFLENLVFTDSLDEIIASSNMIFHICWGDIEENIKLLELLDDKIDVKKMVVTDIIYPYLPKLVENYKYKTNYIVIRSSIEKSLSKKFCIIKSEFCRPEIINIFTEFLSTMGMKYKIYSYSSKVFPSDTILLKMISEYLNMVKEGINPYFLNYTISSRLKLPYTLEDIILFYDRIYLKTAMEKFNWAGWKLTPYELKDIWNQHDRSQYTKNDKIVYDDEIYEVNILRFLAPILNGALNFISEKLYTPNELDIILKDLYNFPKGLFEFGDFYGLDCIHETLLQLYNKYSLQEYQPVDYLSRLISRGKLGIKVGEGFYKWTFQERVFGPVVYRKLNNFALVILSRPEKLNALNEDMWKGLREALEMAENDSVRCVVIRGEGRAFSSGDDISVMLSWKEVKDAETFFKKYASPLLNKLASMKIPVIMVVKGLAYGGGMELLILSDIVVSTKNSEFSIPETLIGAMPPIATTLGLFALNRQILRYSITGEKFGSRKAKELGLVDIVVDEKYLDQVIIELVDRIVDVSPSGVKSVKMVSNKVKSLLLPYLKQSLDELINLSITKNFKEGMASFIQKRRPDWDEE